MSSDSLVPLQGEPGRWAEKVIELREREHKLAEREQRLQRAENVMRVVASDLRDALYLIRDHQNVIARLSAPNPHTAPANDLMRKYQIKPGERASFGIFAYGIDIADPNALELGESIFDYFTDANSTEISGDLEEGERRELPPGDSS